MGTILIRYWPRKPLSPEEQLAIAERMRDFPYFRGCALQIMEDQGEIPATCQVVNDWAMKVDPCAFLSFLNDEFGLQ